MFRKVFICGILLTIVGGAVAGSKKTDAEILTRVGRKVADKVTVAMPDTATIAGPIAAVKTGEMLSVEERVRVRLRTDKALQGATITVALENNAIHLRGIAISPEQTLRAIELAQSTSGVEKVMPELGVVEATSK